MSFLKITDDYDGYELRYPKLLELADRQLEKQLWFKGEARVDKEAIELNYKLSQEQQSAIKKLLPIFLRYELIVSDFWTDVYPKVFKAPECKDAAAAVNMIERCVHARFYDEINKVYKFDKDSDYLSYLDDPAFRERAKWIGNLLKHEDKEFVCLAFGMIEAAALFSAFALIRSFQANGYNLIPATVKGTKQSALDERLHSEILTTTFQYKYAELGTTINEDERLPKLFEQAYVMFANEEHIIDEVIPEEGLNKVSRDQYKLFVKRRIDEYFERLGCTGTPFGVVSSELDEWFDIQNKVYSEPDFFVNGSGKEYESGWNKDAFGVVWS